MRPVVLACVGLAACSSAAPGDQTLSNKTQRRGVAALLVSADGVGPLGAATMATPDELRRVLVGFDVREVDDNGLQYDVYHGDERLAFIVPVRETNRIFNIHVTSSRVEVAGQSWRVDSAFAGAERLSRCECWGEKPTCWKAGEHIAINFDVPDCSPVASADPGVLRRLDGAIVRRIVWSPTPFGAADVPAGP